MERLRNEQEAQRRRQAEEAAKAKEANLKEAEEAAK